MRAYFFVNSWLSGIQKGLQVAHCVTEMAIQATSHSSEQTFFKWAQNHKTIIILEGGSHQDLLDIKSLFEMKENVLPYGSFREDQDSLSGAMTCVGIIVPERICAAAEEIRKEKYENAYVQNVLRNFTEWEKNLIRLLNECSLARN